MNIVLQYHVEGVISHAMNTACIIRKNQRVSRFIPRKLLKSTVDEIFKENEILQKAENKSGLKEVLINFVKHPSSETFDNFAHEVEKDPLLQRYFDTII